MTRERLRWTRTTGQRVVLAINIFLVVTLGIGALGVGYVAQKLADVERLSSGLLDAVEAILSHGKKVLLWINEGAFAVMKTV